MFVLFPFYCMSDKVNLKFTKYCISRKIVFPFERFLNCGIKVDNFIKNTLCPHSLEAKLGVKPWISHQFIVTYKDKGRLALSITPTISSVFKMLQKCVFGLSEEARAEYTWITFPGTTPEGAVAEILLLSSWNLDGTRVPQHVKNLPQEASRRDKMPFVSDQRTKWACI